MLAWASRTTVCALLFVAMQGRADAQDGAPAPMEEDAPRAEDAGVEEDAGAAGDAQIDRYGEDADASSVESLIDSIVSADADLPSDPAAARSAMARALFDEGLAFVSAGRFAEAADRFSRAHALRPAPGIAYNLASALARIGRLVEASELLQWVVRHPDTTDGMRAAAQITIERLAVRLARVQLDVRGPREGVVLLLDGSPLAYAAVDVEVPLDPGTHRFEAVRGDALLVAREVSLAEGARQRIAIELPGASRAEGARSEPLRAPSPTTAETPPRGGHEDLAWLAWSGAALGAAIVVAIVTAAALGSQSGPAEPIPGTTMPAVLEWH